ncbi:MAG TPA: DUF2505 domain-containing protein [Pseudonocardiaceae bacterium]|jgi:hypothetical protein|nr:DUF2505 domain-containing protein [Pseudonocardiaceae bacterium]
MARRIEHRTRSASDAKTVYGTVVDAEYLNQRLAAIGGKNAALFDYQQSPDATSYRLRHGVAAQDLPAALRPLLGGDLKIDRVESWHAESNGAFAGTVRVTIPGMPGDLTGSMKLTDVQGGGSEVLVTGAVSIPIPLFGGKVEEAVADQLGKLLDAEQKFTENWLRDHSS